jgi:indole-3-glycerol phosphate synthase / phosphoribosylanthranilate isomerase
MRFRDALAGPGLAAIAEVKRRSPSAGDLRPSADPARLAAEFERAGAAAVSVLVDDRFGGSIEDLAAARAASSLPLLAKGFFSSPDDLAELRRNGADAVLLLLRDLDDACVRDLMARAAELGLDTLVEAHDATELERAVEVEAPVIGINARDLETFEIDRRAQLALVEQAPADRVVVAESGIHSRAQGPEPAAKLEELISRPLVKVCGLTREEDVAAAAEAGADFAGFVLAQETPRRAPRVLPVPETMLSVAVHVGEIGEEADLVQLYARENGHRARDGVLLRNGRKVARVVDRPWQKEDPEHLERARAAEGRIVLAGGLSPENVAEAIEAVRPWAVDASSSLETAPGIKDHARVRAYVKAARCS